MEQIGIFKKFAGKFLCKLYHPRKTNSHRFYSSYEKPILLHDPERLYIDCVKVVYNFYPQILLDEINEDNELLKYLELPKRIEEYSYNPDNETAYLFEDVLTEGFNMFCNVEANKRGGASHTDIECLYITKKKKFAVESKSTANKLLGIMPED